MRIQSVTAFKFVLLACFGLAMANLASAQAEAPKQEAVPQQEDDEDDPMIEKPAELGGLKAWNELTKSLTKENLKSAIIHDMYLNYHSYNGKVAGAKFDMGVAEDFFGLRDELKFSEHTMHIRDWHNERLYFTATLQDGTEIYVRLATGYISVADCLAMGFNKETLDKIAYEKMTVYGVREHVEQAWRYPNLVKNEVGPMLEKLMDNEAYKNLKADDVVIYRLITGYMTVNKKQTFYFAINHDAGGVLFDLIGEPLSRAP